MQLDRIEKDSILKCYLWFHLIGKHTTRVVKHGRTHITGPETGVPGKNHRQSAVRRRREFKESWEEDDALFNHWNPYLRRVWIFIAVNNPYQTKLKACWEVEIAEFYVCLMVIFIGFCCDQGPHFVYLRDGVLISWYSKTEDKQVWFVENYFRESDHLPWWLSLHVGS